MPGSRISVSMPELVRPRGFRSYVVSGEIIRIRSKQGVHLLQDLRIEVRLSDERNDFMPLVAPCQYSARS